MDSHGQAQLSQRLGRAIQRAIEDELQAVLREQATLTETLPVLRVVSALMLAKEALQMCGSNEYFSLLAVPAFWNGREGPQQAIEAIEELLTAL